MGDKSSRPALSITLEEARRQYDDEERRRDSLESKTSMVIGIDALIISVVSAFFQLSPLVTVIIILPALISAYIGIRILEIKPYESPGMDIEDFYQYVKRDPADVEDTFLISYMQTTEKNKTNNDEKVEQFAKIYILTLGSLILIFLIPISQFLVSITTSYFNYLVDFYSQFL